MRSFVPALLALSLVSLFAAEPAWAGKNKVRHTAVEEPAYASTVAADVGQVTHMRAVDGVVYLAGEKGIAAIGADGATKWRLELPPAAFRNVEADGAGVAFTAYSVAGVEPATGFKSFVMGTLGDAPEIAGATVGAVSADGKLLWQVESDLQTALSAPGLSPSSVAVTRGRDVVAYDRGDGHELGRTPMEFVGQDSKFFAGFFAQATRGQPVLIGDAFYATFIGYLTKTDLSGNKVETSFGPLFKPFYNVTCGPEPFGDLVVFGSTGDSQKGSAFFGVKGDKMKVAFNEFSKDKISGCGSIASNESTLFMASNFHVFAMNEKGKIEWESVNKKGGLYPAGNRGVRYTKPQVMGGVAMGVRKSYADMMVADEKYVYVATANGGDVVTVLDAGTGKYVRTVAVMAPIVGLALVEGKLAVATDADLRLVNVK